MFAPKALPGSPNPPVPNFEHGQFTFDTIVLVSHPIDTKSTFRFVFATILLMDLFFEARFPLRGSIAIGDFCSDPAVPIFLSDAFKRLSNEERTQQWSGCTLLDEAEEVVLELLLGLSRATAATASLRRSSPIHRVSAPISGTPTPRWVLNWSYFMSEATLTEGLRYMQGDALKLKNTTEYLTFLQTLEDDAQFLSPEFLPAKSLKMMKARSGARSKFEDEFGNGVNPGRDYTISFLGA